MTGPGMVSMTLETYAESSARSRRGFAGAMTGKPAFWRRAMVAFQPEASAKTPWTRTTVGFGPEPVRGVAEAVVAAAPVSVNVPAASSPPRTRRRGWALEVKGWFLPAGSGLPGIRDLGPGSQELRNSRRSAPSWSLWVSVMPCGAPG